MSHLQIRFIVVLVLSVSMQVNCLTEILSTLGGDGNLFSGDGGVVYGESDGVSAGGLVSAFLASGDSIFGANAGGINLDRGSSNAFVAGVNGVSGEAEDGVAGYGLLAQIAGLSDSEGFVASQSATGIRGEGDGEVAAANVQQGSVETTTGSAGFVTAGQAIDEGNDPTAYITSDGLAAQTQNSSLSTAVICASSGGSVRCK